MPRNIIKLLEYEAKRRPAVGKLLADIDQLTEDDIAQASVPLPWMRQALLQLKRQRRQAMIMAQEVPGIVEAEIVDRPGEMYQWDGPSQFVRIGRTQIEMQPGQLVWFDGGGLWIDTIYTRIIDPMFNRHAKHCGQTTRQAYMAAVRDRARKLSPEPVTPSPESRVRFFRP